jgi:hypothetical protein
MGSSSSGDASGLAALLTTHGAATPMPNLPIAGSGSSVGDPFKYGKFQSFLPDIKPSGPNPSATGLRPEMFEYRAPGTAPAAGDQIQQLRDELAKLTSSPQPQIQQSPSQPPLSGFGAPNTNMFGQPQISVLP